MILLQTLQLGETKLPFMVVVNRSIRTPCIENNPSTEGDDRILQLDMCDVILIKSLGSDLSSPIIIHITEN